MFPLNDQQLQQALALAGVTDLSVATIRQICSVSAALSEMAHEPFVRLELGNPGLPPAQIGVDAECDALQRGIANQYPDIAGYKPMKDNGSLFLKAFLNVDIDPYNVIPTVGSMQGSYTITKLLSDIDPKRDTMLMLYPGFPPQTLQARMCGMKVAAFDIYSHRGEKMEAALEDALKGDNVASITYSSPNNPAWTNLTEQELEIIGRVSKKHGTIVIEDLAYMGMDFRRDFSKPFQEPYVPTVAHYTDMYILMLSASKIFSYAGQRIAMICISDTLAKKQYPHLCELYNLSEFIKAYIFGVLYACSSGTSHSAQYAMAAMLKASIEGKFNFVETCSEYGRRAAIAKKAFTDNGFHIVYDMDGDKPIGDGFFFTVGYPGMDSDTLQAEMLRYGISAISLPSTGSKQPGLRACVSLLNDPADFKRLNDRLRRFNEDHRH